MLLLKQLWTVIILLVKLWASFQFTNRKQTTKEGSNSNELNHAYRSKWQYSRWCEKTEPLDKTHDDLLLGSDKRDGLHRSDGYRRD